MTSHNSNYFIRKAAIRAPDHQSRETSAETILKNHSSSHNKKQDGIKIHKRS